MHQRLFVFATDADINHYPRILRPSPDEKCFTSGPVEAEGTEKVIISEDEKIANFL